MHILVEGACFFCASKLFCSIRWGLFFASKFVFTGLVTELPDLKEYITEAEEKRFPDSELMQQLVMAVSEAEKCANVAAQLVSKKARTRSVGGGGKI